MSRLSARAWLPPFLLGFLALALQTLLLRQFLWRMEAAGIGVGLFFAAWLAWIGIGALVAQTRPGVRIVEAMARRCPLALGLYLPLAVLQFFLIAHLRGLVGVPDYLASPVGHMALGTILANAPVSFGTGLLFPAATRWLAARGGSAAMAYALDTAGAVTAGVVVTVLLAVGVRLEGPHTRDWQILFPSGRPEGAFTTAAATYLYGTQGGTFYTMTAGGIVDVLPEPEQSAGIAALLLSQRPDAAGVILLGHVPLAVALALHEFQPRARIVWCLDDPAYAEALLSLTEIRLGRRTGIAAAGVGPQSWVAGRPEAFDLALVWPAATATAGGAALLEPAFLKKLAAALNPGGVVALPLGGEPGAWSAEQRRLASAVAANALHVWPAQGMVAPGAGCWWLAANPGGQLADPAAAVARFGKLGVQRFPAAAVADLYDPMRAGQLMREGLPSSAGGGVVVPVPVARHGLAAALHAEWPACPVARWVDWLEAHNGMTILLLALGVLWLVPVAVGGRTAASPRLAMAWLAAGGFLGLAGLLALLQVLEVKFGMLYLLAGLAASLYMGGMFVGNCWADRYGGRRLPDSAALPNGGDPWLSGSMLLVAGAHGAVLLTLLPIVAHASAPWPVLAACFVAGLPAGCYVPVAVARLRQGRVLERSTGAAVIGGDAFGSAVGGITMSLILLPWLGSWMACASVAFFVAGVTGCAVVAAGSARCMARVVLLTCLGAGVLLAILPRGMAAPVEPFVQPPHASPMSAVQREIHASSIATTNMLSVTNAPAVDESTPPVGQSRPVDMGRLRAKQAKGELSNHKAEVWEPEP